MVDEVSKRWGGIDVLVSNAGYAQPCSFEELTDEMWARK
jgi:NAD(P)-dependent dehydrogenase (short-subunit alcohol dehydrogenase family)